MREKVVKDSLCTESCEEPESEAKRRKEERERKRPKGGREKRETRTLSATKLWAERNPWCDKASSQPFRATKKESGKEEVSEAEKERDARG